MDKDDKLAARRSLVRSLGIVALLVVSYALLPLRGDWWWLGALVGTVVLVAILPVTVRRIGRVLQADRPTLEAAEALVLLLAMLVLGFAAIYYGMDRNVNEFVGLDTRVDAVYFTVTTLTTVGYGDITANGQAARMVVTAQMLFNLVFLGVLVRVVIGAARQAGQTGS